MPNLRVELPSRFRRCRSRLCRQLSFGGRQLRKQFRASFAEAHFHIAWTRSGHPAKKEQKVAVSYSTVSKAWPRRDASSDPADDYSIVSGRCIVSPMGWDME